MDPQAKGPKVLRFKAASDNRPGRADRAGPHRSREKAMPDWLLRGMMVLCSAAPLVALYLLLPWLRDLLE